MAGIFQALKPQCLVARVTVLRAEKVTAGWWNDKVDRPDPSIVLKLPRSPNGVRRTRVISNDANPVWNETFEFYMSPKLDNVMAVTLMEKDPLFDDIIQEYSMNLSDLKLNVNHDKELVSKEQVNRIFLKIYITESNEVVLRFGRDICDQEKKFQVKRKLKILEAMKTVLGDKKPKTLDEVPTVAILGSGGGFRAMVGLSGVFCALKEMGIMDCAMYFAGVSGSAMYISTLYSHPEWPEIHPNQVNNDIRACVAEDFFKRLFNPSWLHKCISAIKEKLDRYEPVTYTDLFGYLLGDTLLRDRNDSKLSDQQKTIQDANVPFPLYACVHVKNDVNAKIFADWVELSPYEIGMYKYGTYLTPDAFGNKFFCGVSVDDHPEPPLHFIQGVCGSAFTFITQRLLENPTSIDEPDDRMDSDDGTGYNFDDIDHLIAGNSTKEAIAKWVVDNFSFLKSREGRAAEVHNFLRGLQLAANPADHNKDDIEFMKLNKRLMMCDAGLALNSPFPIFQQDRRQVDLYLSFDFSKRRLDDSLSFKELIKAEKWARLNNFPFPPINHEEQLKLYGIREYYVFKDNKDPSCPTVIHFPLVNNLFKLFKEPGVLRTTYEEKEAGRMSIFEDKDKSYNTSNFQLRNESYDKLFELCNFNTKICNDVICDEMANCVAKKHKQ